MSLGQQFLQATLIAASSVALTWGTIDIGYCNFYNRISDPCAITENTVKESSSIDLGLNYSSMEATGKEMWEADNVKMPRQNQRSSQSTRPSHLRQKVPKKKQVKDFDFQFQPFNYSYSRFPLQY